MSMQTQKRLCGGIGQLLIPTDREDRLPLEKLPGPLLADFTQLHQRHQQDLGPG